MHAGGKKNSWRARRAHRVHSCDVRLRSSVSGLKRFFYDGYKIKPLAHSSPADKVGWLLADQSCAFMQIAQRWWKHQTWQTNNQSCQSLITVQFCQGWRHYQGKENVPVIFPTSYWNEGLPANSAGLKPAQTPCQRLSGLLNLLNMKL